MEWGIEFPPFPPSVPGAVGTDGNGWERMGTDENLSSNFQPYFWCHPPPAPGEADPQDVLKFQPICPPEETG